MASFKSAPASETQEGAGASGDGFAALANLSEGFLGTGYSTATELSFIAMGVVAIFITVSTVRYFLQGSELEEEISDTISLRQN